ncbi:hypothetical protein PHSY_006334 [Pseudozyma hubeiensis SY62]|uniref:DUF803 domain membrane protein n=1 Tax=Pseudozyma hubeiensis (strain SY62) TaxID=1305764 RepID=R9PKW0_PSEHS|nr:hypothetical protein PHSY_006334 [Pseudozyma hubeiensis SY62]GAC98740.1 hypothetical protein PHSY_006334 [Pseudozyma hubeiensis SY62]
MEMLSSSRTWIGVVVAVAGNVTISLALNCQKLAHTRLQRKQHGQSDHNGDTQEHDDTHAERQDSTDRRRSTTGQGASASAVVAKQNGQSDTQTNGHKSNGNSSGNGMDTMFLHSKLWWLGLALMTIGEGGNFISYGFAPASLVAPLGAVALLSNVIISPILLHERFRASDVGGIFLAIIGAVTVVFSSKQNDPRLNPSQLLTAIKRLEFLIYTAISSSSGCLLAFLSTTSLGDRWVLIDVGTCAIFGGFTVLSTKGISSLISGGQPIEALKFPITYGLVVVLAVTAVIQITYLNRALQRFDSREVIPTQFVFFTISAIVGSAILYRDFENMDAHRLINFLFGCLTTFAGVFVLTWRREDQSQEEGDETFEEQHEEEEEEVGEQEPLLGDGRDGSSPKGKPKRIDFLEPPFDRPSNALRVPSATKSSPGRRPRSRTNSPSKATSLHLSGSFDRSSGLSRSASNQYSSSSRTPKLSLMGMDRPTGLSSGHYLLLATPPPNFTLQNVNPTVAGGAGRTGSGRQGQYGAVGKSNPGALLPFPVTTPGNQAGGSGTSGRRGQQTEQIHDPDTSTPATSNPTAAQTIVSPVAETSTPSQDTSAELTSRLADQVANP